MLLDGSGSLWREGKGAKIDREILICVLCTLTAQKTNKGGIQNAIPNLPTRYPTLSQSDPNLITILPFESGASHVRGVISLGPLYNILRVGTRK